MVRARLRYEYVVAVVFVTGLFMDILDTTIVNVALPTLGREFDVGTASIEWVVIGYLLSLAVWIPASGWIGDRFGTKQTFLFALGDVHGRLGAVRPGPQPRRARSRSASCRASAAACSRRSAPRCCSGPSRRIERAKASTVLIIPTVLAPALGPVVGGLLVTDVSWRWIFYVNLPIGIVGVRLRVPLPARAPRADRRAASTSPGSCCRGGGLALVLYALSRGPDEGVAIADGRRSPALLGVVALRAARRGRAHVAAADARAAAVRATACSATPTSCSRCSPTAASPACCSSCRCSCRTCAASPRCSPGSTTFPQAIGVIVSQPDRRPAVPPRRAAAAHRCSGCSAWRVVTASFAFVDARHEPVVDPLAACSLRGIVHGVRRSCRCRPRPTPTSPRPTPAGPRRSTHAAPGRRRARRGHLGHGAGDGDAAAPVEPRVGPGRSRRVGPRQRLPRRLRRVRGAGLGRRAGRAHDPGRGRGGDDAVATGARVPDVEPAAVPG